MAIVQDARGSDQPLRTAGEGTRDYLRRKSGAAAESRWADPYATKFALDGAETGSDDAPARPHGWSPARMESRTDGVPHGWSPARMESRTDGGSCALHSD